MPVATQYSIPSLGGRLIRHRPVIAVQLTGPADTRLRDGLLDTGADDTVFTESLADLLGVDLDQAEERLLVLAGRPHAVRCRYAPVKLRVTDGFSETHEWMAVVGFVSARLHYNLLGHAGFLEFFDAQFQGADQTVILTPNRCFPGTQSTMPGPP